jgi:hypothetical protein
MRSGKRAGVLLSSSQGRQQNPLCVCESDRWALVSFHTSQRKRWGWNTEAETKPGKGGGWMSTDTAIHEMLGLEFT